MSPLEFGKLSYDIDAGNEPSSGGIGSIEATHPEHGYVGHIYWNTDPKYKGTHLGGVTNIAVDERFQRQGLGTHLYRMAQGIDPKVSHSSSSQQTPQGKKWAKAVGP